MNEKGQKTMRKKRSPKFKVKVVYKETPDAKDRLHQLWDLLLSLPDSDKAKSESKRA
jgi:hypothetical protein